MRRALVNFVCVILWTVGATGIPTENEDLYLVRGDMLVFSDSSTLADKKAVIDSMLFSELASDKKYEPGGTETYSAKDWFSYYTSNVMLSIGWATTGSTSFTFPTFHYVLDTQKSHLHELSQAVVGEVTRYTKSQKFHLQLNRLFQGLSNSSDGLELFSNEHGSYRSDLFLVALADNEQGRLTLTILALQVDLDLSSTDQLLCRASKLNYKVAFTSKVLSRDIFDHVQKTIESRLGDHLKTDVVPVVASSSIVPNMVSEPAPPCPASSAVNSYQNLSLIFIIYLLYNALL